MPFVQDFIKKILFGGHLIPLEQKLTFFLDHPWPGITLGIQSVPKATMSHCSIMRAAPRPQSLISGPSQVQI